ncbi:multidrug-efflux transport protein precursor [Bacteroidales bacterium]|nr:multidrug-efflux transport protein precursor [Bacteroidales bacterium]
MMLKKGFLWAIALILLASACGKKDDSQNIKEEIKIKVNTQIVREETLSRILTYTANIEGDKVNNISPAMPMRIKRIFVEVGDRVVKGQKLVEMDNSNLEQQGIQLKNLERDYKRYQELLKVGGIAQQQVDQMRVQLEVSQAAIANMQENTVLTSPTSGIVSAKNYDNGDVYGGQPILTVQQINPVKAIINVSEAYFPEVKTNMPIEIKLDVYAEEIFAGRVKLIHPTIDPLSHTFRVEIEINNADLRVRPGMFAQVSINFGSYQKVVIPDNAVVKQVGANDRFVFIVENDRAVYKKVELGQRFGDKWEIIAGINSGDLVVTGGKTRLMDGIAVEILKK